MLVKATEEEAQDIINRQKAMLETGFAMGKLQYRKRDELHEDRE